MLVSMAINACYQLVKLYGIAATCTQWRRNICKSDARGANCQTIKYFNGKQLKSYGAPLESGGAAAL